MLSQLPAKCLSNPFRPGRVRALTFACMWAPWSARKLYVHAATALYCLQTRDCNSQLGRMASQNDDVFGERQTAGLQAVMLLLLHSGYC